VSGIAEGVAIACGAMDARLRSRIAAGAVLLSAGCIGIAACGGSNGGGTAGATTSIPVSTSFRTIPVTSTTTTAPPPSAAPAASGAGAGSGGAAANVYTVKAGDAWPLIARRVGVPLDQLLAYNGATASTPVYVGDKIRIPPPQGSASAGTSAGSTPASSDAGGQVSADGTLYTVKSGDTWITIAKKLGVDWKALMQINGVTPEVNSKAPLTVGGQIKVPPKA
jgi:LysM repeat protein